MLSGEQDWNDTISTRWNARERGNGGAFVSRSRNGMAKGLIPVRWKKISKRKQTKSIGIKV